MLLYAESTEEIYVSKVLFSVWWKKEFDELGWPEDVSHFVREVPLLHPPEMGTTVDLSDSYHRDLSTRVEEVKYHLEYDEWFVFLSIEERSFTYEYFVDPKNRWEPRQ